MNLFEYFPRLLYFRYIMKLKIEAPGNGNKNRGFFIIVVPAVKILSKCCSFIWSGGLIITGITWYFGNFIILLFMWPSLDTKMSFSDNMSWSIMGNFFKRSISVIFKNARVLSLPILIFIFVQENIGNITDFCESFYYLLRY